MELTFILPVALTLLFGCIDLSRAIHAQSAIANAARVGAEYGATHRPSDDALPLWEAQIRDVATEEALCVASNLNALDVQVSSDGTAGVDLRVTVTASTEYRPVIGWPGFPDVVPLRHQVCMLQYQ